MKDSSMDFSSTKASNLDTGNENNNNASIAPNKDDLVAGLSSSLKAFSETVSEGKLPQELRFSFSHQDLYFITKALYMENSEARLNLCGSIDSPPLISHSSDSSAAVCPNLIDKKTRHALRKFQFSPATNSLFLPRPAIPQI